METFFLKRANEYFLVSGHSNWRVDAMGIKIYPKTFPSGMCYCDGYVKYEQSKVIVK